MKLKQEREYKQDYPVPSGFSPSTKTTKSRIPVALQSPLKNRDKVFKEPIKVPRTRRPRPQPGRRLD